MLNLYSVAVRKEGRKELTDAEKYSVYYHNIFDYPLSLPDLIKWRSGKKFTIDNLEFSIANKSSFYYLEGRVGLVYKRILRKRISAKKLLIAKKASKILSLISTIKMVAVTGSLAMENASEESDIDLMIVTKKGTLWTTRLLVYVVIHAFGFGLRKPNDWQQKDRLCLNIWMDESDLSWRKNQNVYTAHEIAQIVPLVNKDKTYEKILSANCWILSYWPLAVRVQSTKYKVQSENFLSTVNSVLTSWLEPIAYKFQYQHMKSRITREVITPTRALFHPQDWGKVVLKRLLTV